MKEDSSSKKRRWTKAKSSFGALLSFLSRLDFLNPTLPSAPDKKLFNRELVLIFVFY